MKKETLELIEKIKKELKKILSEERYNHSIAVMEKAIELAKIYEEDIDSIALAALTHDIAKELSDEETLKTAKENNIKLDDVTKNIPNLLHGKIGSILVKEKYGFNEQIQRAITFHTFSNPDMNMFEKIIYVSDMLEETRSKPEELIKWRELVKKDMDETIIQIINFNLNRLVKLNSLINPIMLETRNKLLLNKK